ncbi:MAG: asparagine synthase (glutamine-hydrolyzing) [Legionellaceae bacterium]|nr:asparagine synthase (glutamine-hydrolyzing) [Legionellaceae bacterium]
MCGIAGIVDTKKRVIEGLHQKLSVMGELIAHRGPDADGVWMSPTKQLGFAHRRLSILDLSEEADQPMRSPLGDVIVFNGEIYNYIELRDALKPHWSFQTDSDTEVILAAYRVYGVDCVKHFKGMFAFVLWDGENLFCARDHFGIKPFYYTWLNDVFYFASESKALLPFLPSLSTNRQAFVEYVTFQYPMGEQTLFEHVQQLEPAHAMLITPTGVKTWRYWDVQYQIDYSHTEAYFSSRLEELITESVALHLRADVNVGAYVSGGIDSSLIGLLASNEKGKPLPFFHGRFLEGEQYDESSYAHAVAEKSGSELHVCDITANDFENTLQQLMYHLDFPVAGPGVFPQYMVSEMAAKHVKVVLGGQGGDEIFGGYARYVIAYFEQCIKAAIEGNYKQGNFVVTAESIIPNLEVLKAYKPLLKRFWSEGLFEPLDKRYFSLVNRAPDLKKETQLTAAEHEYVFNKFLDVFNNAKFQRADSYFDSMTHFDFKCLLPGLLHVEDRMSMAHGLEARVPFLYYPLIEFMATIPANIKFADGRMKHLLKQTFSSILPEKVLSRKDKMGFPVPLSEWMGTDLKAFLFDILKTGVRRQDGFIDYQQVLVDFEQSKQFSRKQWGFLCYEVWQQQFHDKQMTYKKKIQSHTALC